MAFFNYAYFMPILSCAQKRGARRFYGREFILMLLCYGILNLSAMLNQVCVFKFKEKSQAYCVSNSLADGWRMAFAP
jgi:hypothetical protein